MREHLIGEFAKLYELHLHGGVNEIGDSAKNDQNVFDISQAVAIHAYVRLPAQARATDVLYAELWGPRTAKYDYLTSGNVASTKWDAVRADAAYCSFLPQGDSDKLATARLDDVFAKFGAGIKTNRDAVAVGFSESALTAAVEAFDARLIADTDLATEAIRPILYRPFDERVIFYHEDVVASRSLPTMQHMLAGPNLALVASSTWTSPERFSVNVSRLMVEMKTGTHDRGTTAFPLYRYESILGATPEKVVNIQDGFARRWEGLTGITLETNSGGAGGVPPEALFHWIYAVCYSPEYRSRYRPMLAQGFPIVVFPRTIELFDDIGRLGCKLMNLHLMDSPAVDEPPHEYVGPRRPEVGRVAWSEDTVWLDAPPTRGGQPPRSGTIGFHGVSTDVWAFHMGGYPVCYKWLKDRKRRRLSPAEILRYRKILAVIGETLGLMKEIDLVVRRHGGWPDAFAQQD